MSALLGNLQNHIAQMAPHQKERLGGQLIVQSALRIAALEAGITRVAIECNCRAEHGAEGAEHLLAIEKMLFEVLKIQPA